MSIIKKALPVVMSALMLFGCAGSDSSSSGASKGGDSAAVTTDKNGSEEKKEKTQAELDSSMGKTLPVIDIQTKNTDKLDFVTKPVAEHVSKQQAMWTPNFKMPPAPYYEDCTITVTGIDGAKQIDGAEAEVKVRGNWTTTYAKKSLRIKFAEKQSMLGLNEGQKYKNWVLLAGYKDGSLLRDKTALEMAREILEPDGFYASDSQLVEININGKYFGVYLLAELQQINNGRVSVTKAEKDYKGTDIGYLLEFDGYYYTEPDLQRFKCDYNDNAPLTPYDGNGGGGKEITVLGDDKTDLGFTIKNDIYSREQRDFIAGFVNNVYKIMYEAAYNNKAYVFDSAFKSISETSDITPREAVEKVVDTDSLADMFVISELTCDADIYLTSFFMSADFGEGGSKKLRFEAPWDFDSSMGNKDRCANGRGFYAGNTVPDVNGNQFYTVNPWLCVLMYQSWYTDIIKEKWTKAYDAGVFTRAHDMILSDTETFSDAFVRNYNKWDNIRNNRDFAGELSFQAASCRTHEAAAGFLAEWLESRVQFMNEHWHK